MMEGGGDLLLGAPTFPPPSRSQEEIKVDDEKIKNIKE